MTSEYHRFFIGGEMAEAKACRERGRGYQSYSLDNGVSPEDYKGWEVQGEDCLCFAVDHVSQSYADKLGLVLIAEGARHVAIFNLSGQCLFGHLPANETLPLAA